MQIILSASFPCGSRTILQLKLSLVSLSIPYARWLQRCDKTPTEVASEPLTNHDMMAIMKSTTHERGKGNDDDPCKNDVLKDDWVDETTA
ncbi:hypothetical protein H9L39_18956 [Fusarium oxysporum f. sp. albedinis]|nr:hypothetical protein H9L39_18956 [Fusarium oxysporum f. sp. albedinis]